MMKLPLTNILFYGVAVFTLPSMAGIQNELTSYYEFEGNFKNTLTNKDMPDLFTARIGNHPGKFGQGMGKGDILKSNTGRTDTTLYPGTGDWTLSAWFSVSGNQSARTGSCIVSCGATLGASASYGGAGGWSIWLANNNRVQLYYAVETARSRTLALDVDVSGIWAEPTENKPAWNNVIITRKKTILALYINGKHMGNAQLPPQADIKPGKDEWFREFSPNFHFRNSNHNIDANVAFIANNGLDDMATWNRSLTEKEIASINARKGQSIKYLLEYSNNTMPFFDQFENLYSIEMSKLENKYVASLKKLQQNYVKNKDFASVSLIQKILKEPNVPPQIDELPKDILHFVKAYTNQKHQIKEQIKQLYLKKLQQIQAQYAQKKQFDKIVEIQKIIKTIKETSPTELFMKIKKK